VRQQKHDEYDTFQSYPLDDVEGRLDSEIDDEQVKRAANQVATAVVIVTV